MAKKKKTSTSRPEVPHVELAAPTEMGAPKYEPMSVDDFNNFMNASYETQLRYAPQLIGMQQQAQTALYNNMAGLQRQNAGANWGAAYGLVPQRFRRNWRQLGDSVNQELAQGYELGPGLGREVTQAIRGAQTARGNILGAAPTAQEAFGTGQAALNLYNQRVGQAQNFLQGRNTADVAGQQWSAYVGQPYYPSQAYVNQGLGAQGAIAAGNQGQAYNETVQKGYSSFQGALQNYNQNQLTGEFGTYDRSAESWMYDEAVRRGLYSTPQVGGGAGGGGMGMAMQGIGAAGTAAMGLAASGVIGAGATAAGVGAAGGIAAAASAAGAAICWLARRCIPARWEEFQHYLFTHAPEKLRRLYIYNARRLAREINDDKAIEIGELMLDVLSKRCTNYSGDPIGVDPKGGEPLYRWCM